MSFKCIMLNIVSSIKLNNDLGTKSIFVFLYAWLTCVMDGLWILLCFPKCLFAKLIGLGSCVFLYTQAHCCVACMYTSSDFLWLI